MRFSQSNVLETVRRVQAFMDRNAGDLGDVNASGARKTLDRVEMQLSAHAADQVAGHVNAKGETANQRALRLALRLRHMRPIAAIARAKLRDVPSFHALTLPDSRLNGSRTAASAAAMADVATQHASVFVEQGLSADFVERLRAATEAVKQSVDGRAASRGRKVSGTRGLSSEEKNARAQLNVLDSMVVPLLLDKDALLAEWRSLRRINAKPGPVIGSETAEPESEPSPKAA
jgi:hypothetical protein